MPHGHTEEVSILHRDYNVTMPEDYNPFESDVYCIYDGNVNVCEVRVRFFDWSMLHIAAPIAVQMLIIVFFFFLANPIHEYCLRKSKLFERFILTYIGTAERPQVAKPFVLSVLFAIQVLASVAAVVIQIIKFHKFQAADVETIEAVLVAFDVFDWGIHRLRTSFTVSGCCELNALIDVLTCTPFLLKGFPQFSGKYALSGWLTLNYLRAYRALFSFERIEATGIFRHRREIMRGLIRACLRIVAMILIFSGGLATIELFGDPPSVHEVVMQTNHGQVSFFQMLFFVISSVTFVGIEDYRGNTWGARVVVWVFIFFGLYVIICEILRLREIYRRDREGYGSYTSKPKDQHVIAMFDGSKMNSVVIGFLHEILQSRKSQSKRRYKSMLQRLAEMYMPNQKERLNVILCSPHPFHKRYHEFIKRELNVDQRSQVHLLLGSPDSVTDMARAQIRTCLMAFLLSNPASATPEADDHLILTHALNLRQMNPELRMRVMLLLPQSKLLAAQCGVDPARCFSAREMKVSLMATNVRCHGVATAVQAMFKTTTPQEKEH
eukprot:gene1079-1070_t